MIQNEVRKDYPDKVTNELTKVLDNNFLDVVIEKNKNIGVTLESFMEKDCEDGEHFKLYSGSVYVGSVTIENNVITYCSIHSTFRQGKFAIYKEDVNDALKSFLGRKINI